MAWQKVSEEQLEQERTHRAGKGVPGEGKWKQSHETATVRLSPAQGWERRQRDAGAEQAGGGHSLLGRAQPPVVLTTISFSLVIWVPG